MKNNIIKKAAIDAFDVADMINGLLSGGIFPPRKLFETVVTGNKAVLTFTYQDGYYHDTRAGIIYKEVFVLKDDELSIEGKDTLFPIDKEDSFYDFAEPYITEFLERHKVKARGFDDARLLQSSCA